MVDGMNGSRPGELPLECGSCVVGQAFRTAREAGLPEAERQAVVVAALDWMSGDGPDSRSTLLLGRRITDLVLELARLPRDFDIYHEPKALSNRLAATHLERLRESIAGSDDRLEQAVRISAAGNVIDFGAKDHAKLDIEGELATLDAQRFEHFDIEEFRHRAACAKSILLVCDNAGEIVFDILLLEELRHINPQATLHAAFRESPILNDATMDDAKTAGIDSIAEILSSGSHLGGTILAECSKEFQRRFLSADLVVSKGQGNFSGLINDADERVFFLFRTKCDPIARRSGTTRGTLQLVRGGRLDRSPAV